MSSKNFTQTTSYHDMVQIRKPFFFFLTICIYFFVIVSGVWFYIDFCTAIFLCVLLILDTDSFVFRILSRRQLIALFLSRVFSIRVSWYFLRSSLRFSFIVSFSPIYCAVLSSSLPKFHLCLLSSYRLLCLPTFFLTTSNPSQK